MNLKEHPLYGHFKERSQRAQSPVREEVTKMSPQDLENKLNVTISKDWFGRYKHEDVDIARRIFEKTKPKSESPESRVFIPFIPSENSPSNRPYSPSDFKYPLYKPVAAQERAAQNHRNPITPAHIAAAELNYQNWRVAADRSATTHRDVSPKNAYDVLGKQRDAALVYLEKLQREFEDQKRMTPGAHEGGKSKRVKSKRVKSKRNKQNTKRRNTRK